MQLANLAGWLGAALMVCAAPFAGESIYPFLTIAGLSLLTCQQLLAGNAKQWNLILLNIASIAGFIFSIFYQ